MHGVRHRRRGNLLPLLYTPSDWMDLGPLAAPPYPDDGHRLRDWADAFARGRPTDTLSLLKDLSAGVSATLSYQSRKEEGTQHPIETLDRKRGSCRNFAVLFVEAARTLGFGARLVSGYLFVADDHTIGSAGPGTTHAWAEVYVPGAGWIQFDPTNRRVSGANLIPVAVGRDIWQVTTIVGTFIAADAFQDMTVEVTVRMGDQNPTSALPWRTLARDEVTRARLFPSALYLEIPLWRHFMRLKPNAGTNPRFVEPTPSKPLPESAKSTTIGQATLAAPKPHEELRLGRSKGQIGPKSLPPRRGTAK